MRKLNDLTNLEIDEINRILSEDDQYLFEKIYLDNYQDIEYKCFTKNTASYSGISIINVYEYLKSIGVYLISQHNDIPVQIISYLNEKTGKRLKPVNGHIKFINARLKEGYNLKDFKKVIDIKTIEWKGTTKEKFLRPKTLFNSENFDCYLNQLSNINDLDISNILSDCFKRQVSVPFVKKFKDFYKPVSIAQCNFYAKKLSIDSRNDLMCAINIFNGAKI